MSDFYIFESERIGFREWKQSDLAELHRLNSDKNVMHFFERTMKKEESKIFLNRMQLAMAKWGYCYYAVERKKDGLFMGMIGLYKKEFESDFTPAVDIGVRLHQEFWNKNYGTEGVRRCIKYAFESLQIRNLVAICSKTNLASARTLEKAGLVLQGEFTHPLMHPKSSLQPCCWFLIEKEA